MELNYVYSKKTESFESSSINDLKDQSKTTSRDDIGFLSELENSSHYDSTFKVFKASNTKKFFILELVVLV